MAINFTGSSYSEFSSGDLRTSTEAPYWAFGTNTSITGALGPGDPSGLYSNGWQDSIAIDTQTSSGGGDPFHPRALIAGHTYRFKVTFSAFEQANLKFESDTHVINSYSFSDYGSYTFTYDLTINGGDFINVCLNGWSRNSNGSLGAVNYEVTISDITPPKPDLTDTVTSLGASSVEVGEAITVNHTLKNIGNAGVASQKFGTFLSLDSVFDSSDVFLGEYTTGAVAAGETQLWSSVSLPVPLNVGPGSYYVGIFADYNGGIAEESESNNISWRQITITDTIHAGTGLPQSAGFGTSTPGLSDYGDRAAYDSAIFSFNANSGVWTGLLKGGRVVYSYSQLAAAGLYDFLADETTDAVREFAEEQLDEHPSLLSGGLLAFEAYEQTQSALVFKESTENFFKKTMTRIQNTLDDYLDPSIPEDQKRSLDLNAVEADLKQYWKDLVDEKIGLPVNSALDFLDNAVKSARVMLGNSDVRARLDIDPVAGGILPLAAAAGHHDGILGSNNADAISGGDLIDLIYGAAGNDTLRGGSGSDILIGGDGNDLLFGDTGEDILSGGSGNDQLDGGFGYDEMRGGAGDDTFMFNSSADQAIEAASQGIDTILSSVSLSALPTNVENATLTGFGWNSLAGSGAWNVLTGNSGNNVLSGGLGNDTLVGKGGKDTLTGGGGLDKMVYESIVDSGPAFSARDVINTFAHGDKIDLSAIDANNGVAGNQAFSFVSAFTGVAGQLQWDLTNISPTGVKGYLVQGDVNGDAAADFSLQIYTSPTTNLAGGSAGWNLAAWDFIL